MSRERASGVGCDEPHNLETDGALTNEIMSDHRVAMPTHDDRLGALKPSTTSTVDLPVD
jgi:hypothetical protein